MGPRKSRKRCQNRIRSFRFSGILRILQFVSYISRILTYCRKLSSSSLISDLSHFLLFWSFRLRFSHRLFTLNSRTTLSRRTCRWIICERILSSHLHLINCTTYFNFGSLFMNIFQQPFFKFWSWMLRSNDFIFKILYNFGNLLFIFPWTHFSLVDLSF